MEKYKKGFKRKEDEMSEEKNNPVSTKFHFSNVKVIPGPVIDDPVSPFYAGGDTTADNESESASKQAGELPSLEETVFDKIADREESVPTAAAVEDEVSDVKSEAEEIAVAEEKAVEEAAAFEFVSVPEKKSADEAEAYAAEEIVSESEDEFPADINSETEIEAEKEVETEMETKFTAEPEQTSEEEPAFAKLETVIIPEEPKVIIPLKSETEVKKAEPVEEEDNTGSTICIIDETSTSVTIEEGPDISVDEIIPSETTRKAKKPKAPKQPLKLKPIQIILMAVVGVVALWFIIFTVDHTLAANGISPVFCKKEVEYDDGSVSYKGLGYKVQFKFDSQGNLTQMVLPAWKDGPNDVSDEPIL